MFNFGASKDYELSLCLEFRLTQAAQIILYLQVPSDRPHSNFHVTNPGSLATNPQWPLESYPMQQVGSWFSTMHSHKAVLLLVVFAYFFCHRTASDSDYWMIRTLFIARSRPT